MLKYKILRNVWLEFTNGYAFVADDFIKQTSVIFIQNLYVSITESTPIAYHSLYTIYTPQTKDGSMYIYGRSAADSAILFESTLPVNIMIINYYDA